MSRFIIIFTIFYFCGKVPNAEAISSVPCLIWGQSAKKRDDYTYTPGVGAHKVHTRAARGWNSGRRTCQEEGGHLAIINSVAEAQTVGDLLKNVNLNYAHIGIHNYFDNNEWLTVNGESLSQAGYTKWADGQPSGTEAENCKEHCGGIDSSGSLHDVCCGEHWKFVCELSVH